MAVWTQDYSVDKPLRERSGRLRLAKNEVGRAVVVGGRGGCWWWTVPGTELFRAR